MIDHQEIGLHESVELSPGLHHAGQARPIEKPKVREHLGIADRKVEASSLAQPDGRLEEGEAAPAEESFSVCQVAQGEDDLVATRPQSHREREDRAEVPIAGAEFPRVEDSAHAASAIGPRVLTGMSRASL